MRPKLNNLLLVGSTSKNAGKTTFILKIIERFSRDFKINCLKIRPNESQDGLKVFKESSTEGITDTSKYLLAGADESYLIDGKGEDLLEFILEMSKSKVVIVESTSLIKHLDPALFIMFKGSEGEKLISNYSLNVADLIVENYKFNYDRLELENGIWRLKENI